jgi:diguanylate cyclase (GGDEF)-like protein
MGGDEFLLILPDTDIRAGEFLAQRLCQAVDNLDVFTDEGKLGVSIGLSEWKNNYSKKEWIERADDTLYKAKAQGKARVIVN